MKMETIRDFIYDRLPRPRVLGAARQVGAPARIMVLSKHPNPTFSYYLEERLGAIDSVPVGIKGLDDRLEDVDPRGLFVIVCRYIKPKQLTWLEKNRNKLAGVALFVDDDIASVFVGNEADWLYKCKLFYLAIWPTGRLNHILSDIWVSTDGLAKALEAGGEGIKVLPPFPPANVSRPRGLDQADALIKMAYHATGVHRLEHEFLVPIVETVLEKYPNLNFEVFANRKTARLWHRTPAVKERIAVKPPLSWHDYLEEASFSRVDISLVPLLESRTNNSRSGTKRIDVSRCGAAAIFSRCSAYKRDAIDGELHVENTVEAWVSAIDDLMMSADRRSLARQATALSVEKMRDTASLELPGLSLTMDGNRKTFHP